MDGKELWHDLILQWSILGNIFFWYDYIYRDLDVIEIVPSLECEY